MVTKELTIINKLGIHARPAAQFVKLASKFDADIVVEKDGEEVDGKSILGLMMLAVGHGSKITITAEGEGCGRRRWRHLSLRISGSCVPAAS